MSNSNILVASVGVFIGVSGLTYCILTKQNVSILIIYIVPLVLNIINFYRLYTT